MRPEELKTQIFLDSANPEDTKRVKSTLGFLDGQTTNPTLLANLLQGETYPEEELFKRYQEKVAEIFVENPTGWVSIEVPATNNTSVKEMINYAYYLSEQFDKKTQHIHIKLPTNEPGLRAAYLLTNAEEWVNMTLGFTQRQAQAVYLATQGAADFQVLFSPFIRRLEGNYGLNGMQLLKNIITMYKEGDGHVKVLAASIGNVDQLMEAIHLGADIVTTSAPVLIDWADRHMPLPAEDFCYQPQQPVAEIPYRKLSLERADWRRIKVTNRFTSDGLASFTKSWNSLKETNLIPLAR